MEPQESANGVPKFSAKYCKPGARQNCQSSDKQGMRHQDILMILSRVFEVPADVSFRNNSVGIQIVIVKLELVLMLINDSPR